jgi:hypothetical protein
MLPLAACGLLRQLASGTVPFAAARGAWAAAASWCASSGSHTGAAPAPRREPARGVSSSAAEPMPMQQPLPRDQVAGQPTPATHPEVGSRLRALPGPAQRGGWAHAAETQGAQHDRQVCTSSGLLLPRAFPLPPRTTVRERAWRPWGFASNPGLAGPRPPTAPLPAPTPPTGRSRPGRAAAAAPRRSYAGHHRARVPGAAAAAGAGYAGRRRSGHPFCGDDIRHRGDTIRETVGGAAAQGAGRQRRGSGCVAAGRWRRAAAAVESAGWAPTCWHAGPFQRSPLLSFCAPRAAVPPGRRLWVLHGHGAARCGRGGGPPAWRRRRQRQQHQQRQRRGHSWWRQRCGRPPVHPVHSRRR